MSGKHPNPRRLEIEKQISHLNLELAKAKSVEQVHQIRDKIFSRKKHEGYTSIGTWKSQPWQPFRWKRVRQSLSPNELVLEYVMANPIPIA